METEAQSAPRPALPQRKRGHEWYLVLNRKCEEMAVFHKRVGEAMDFAFELGKGSAVITVGERGAEPDTGSQLFYIAEEREYMIRLANGHDYGHFTGETRCCLRAEELGPGTTVTRLGRDLREGPVIYTAR